MASAVSICNSALIKVGADRITALSDDTPRAILCNEQFEKLRDEVLRAHPWNFAIERVELAAVSGFEDPLEYWAYKFALPSDCLRVLNCAENASEYRVEGRYLLSQDSTAAIRYIKKVTDYSIYDPNFIEALSTRIAADLAYGLTRDANLGDSMMKKYQMMIAHARSLDGQEGTPEGLIVDTWTDARI